MSQTNIDLIESTKNENRLEKPTDKKIVIIGAGPSGLSAAYEACKHGYKPIVFEKSIQVGGIARTEFFEGYYFDMGGHRFFTKSAEINLFWKKVMEDKFLLRPRLSRIYYNHKFFNYPLKPVNALTGLGLWQAMLISLSYLRWQIFPYKREETFEQWVTNRFGYRLFSIFFKSYTEKVWGISTSELSAEWAAQRIKDLDLKTAILSMFIKPKKSIKTLIEEFHYPSQGPGMLWGRVKDLVEDKGGEVRLNSQVIGINRNGNIIQSLSVMAKGECFQVEGSDFISSAPITELIQALNPPPPDEVLYAAQQLTYRDFLTVCLIVDKEFLFEDNWIYVHDPKVKVGRIQNFKNWSPEMVADPKKTSLGLEYFCNEGDDLWNSDDADLIELGKRELDQIGLAKYQDIIAGVVYRVEKSYPVYDSTYRQHLDVIKEYVQGFANLQTIGRNGLHRYNNQDHAMLTGIFAVRNTILGQHYDLWSVNAEQEYHEEVKEQEHRLDEIIDHAFAEAFKKLEPIAFGLSTGIVGGMSLFLVTFFLSFHQQLGITKFFWLLGQYLPYYSVRVFGSIFGLFYGLLIGALIGWSYATIRNNLVKAYVGMLRRRAEIKLIQKSGYLLDAQSVSSQNIIDELKDG